MTLLPPSLDARLSHASGVTSVELDGETVVLHEGRAELHHLDAVATRVWTRLDGQTSLRDTCQALADEFGVDLAKVQSDVQTLVARLARDNMLEIR
jgi:hypothetical protein